MSKHHLAYLGFQLHKPSPLLRDFVQDYWIIRSQDFTQYREEFLHPSGGLGIIFNFGDKLFLDGQPTVGHSFLDAANSVSRRLNFRGEVYAIGIRFFSGGAYPFFKMPIFEIVDKPYQLADLDISDMQSVQEQLYHAISIEDQVKVLDDWLLTQRHENQIDVLTVYRATDMIRQSHGRRFVSDISRDIGISTRQLQRQFKAQVGISPKHHAKLIRVDYARTAIKRLGHNSLADIAYQAGYYDQSHFIREFKSIVGMTPKAYSLRHQNR